MTRSKAALDDAFNAIVWAHSVGGKASPAKEAFVAATLKGLQRRHAKSVTKKKPFTIEMLQAIAAEATKTKSLSCHSMLDSLFRFSEV